MKGFFKYLTVFYTIEIILGLFGSVVVGLIVGTMSTDSPSSTQYDFYFGLSLGFLSVFIPAVILPYLAIRELEKFEEKKRLLFNILSAIPALFSILSPFVLFNFFIFYKLKNPDIIKDEEDYFNT